MGKYSLSQITSLMKTSKQEQLVDISEISDLCYENDNGVDSTTCQGGMQNVRVVFSNKKSSLLLVLKVCDEASPLAVINESLHIFDKEISFYSDIVPYICKFERNFFSKNLFQDLFVNFYGAGHVENDIVIILERLSDDYIVFPRDDFLRSKEEIQRVLKSLAVFHASSYAMKCKSQVNFRVKFPILKEYLFDFNSNDVFFKLTDQLYRNNIKLLKAVVEDSKYKNALVNHGLLINFDHSIISRLENLSSKIVLILQNIQFGNEESNLLCHGDFHMWNIAFSKSSEKVKFFDFQLIRYAPCMTDFHQYLSQVSSASFRQSHLPNLMHTYIEAFQEVCQQYGIKQDRFYTESALLEEYKSTSPWGFIFGFLFNLRRFVPPDFYIYLEKLNSNDEIIEFLLVQTSKAFWDMISFYLSNLQELEELDGIGIMERLSKI